METFASTLRSFQQNIVSCARQNNVVMVGNTGIGKTYVAIALLSEQDYSGRKRAFFMAPTRQLIIQIQAKIIQITTLPVRSYLGSEVDTWDEIMWKRELALYKVFVCTPQIVRSALEKSFLSIREINLLVFDECHHVSKRHPYAHIMKFYDISAPKGEMPRIFGATACPTRDCAGYLYAELHNVELKDEEMEQFAAAAPLVYIKYAKASKKDVTEASENVADSNGMGCFSSSSEYRRIASDLQEAKVVDVFCKLFTNTKKKMCDKENRVKLEAEKFLTTCLNIYDNLGLWCFYRFIELEIERLAVGTACAIGTPGSMLGWDQDAVTTILMLSAKRTRCDFDCSPKVQKALEIIQKHLVDNGEFVESDENKEYTASENKNAKDEQTENVKDSSNDYLPINEMKADEAVKSTNHSMQGILFLQTRIDCRVLTEYLNDVFKEKILNQKAPEEVAEDSDFMDIDFMGNDDSNRFDCILGQFGKADCASFALADLNTILQRFQRGTTRMLVSTAVSAEGIDFPQCGLIIVMQPVQSARLLIQLRGRARHDDGIIYYLGEEGNLAQEIHFKTTILKADEIKALNFSNDKTETMTSLPRSKFVDCQAVPHKKSVTIEESGAVLDLDNSVSCLYHFLQSLPVPLYEVNYTNLYAYTEMTTKYKKRLFKAKLSLPEELGIPPFESDLMPSKALAKAAAALQACQELIEQGLIDPKLNSVYRKRRLIFEKQRNDINLDFFLKRL